MVFWLFGHRSGVVAAKRQLVSHYFPKLSVAWQREYWNVVALLLAPSKQSDGG